MTHQNEVPIGISCDEPDCDFVDTTIALGDYKTQVNRPCPDCGASLLDGADYAKIQILLEILNIQETTPQSTVTQGDVL